MIWVGLLLLLVGTCIIGSWWVARRARREFLARSHQLDVRLAGVAQDAKADYQRKFGRKPEDLETGKFVTHRER
jgi:hypothetical protein